MSPEKFLQAQRADLCAVTGIIDLRMPMPVIDIREAIAVTDRDRADADELIDLVLRDVLLQQF